MRGLFVLVSVLILIGIVSASIDVASHNIEKTYPQGGMIKGWINFSSTNEPASNLFATSFGNSISIYNFLNKTIGENNFECVPENCDKAYVASAASQSKTFQLNTGNSRKRIVGFVLTGSLDSINSGKFTFTSNAPASCTNQIEIDILDDGIIDIANNNTLVGAGVCPSTRTYGCYSGSEVTKQIDLDIACQKMNLSVSPGFVVGAQIKRELGDRKLKMEIIDKRGISREICELPTLALGEDKEIYCEINFLVTEKSEFYVCARADGGSDANNRYTIKGYRNKTNGCGVASLPSPNYEEDLVFKISAVGKQFGPVIQTEVIDALPNGERFSDVAFNYIEDQYGYALDCDSTQCVIPISVKGSVDQDVVINNAELKYTMSSALFRDNNIFDVAAGTVKINSDYKKINLEPLNLSVPSQTGNATFTLSYNGEDLFSEEITVAQIPVIESLIPTQAPAVVDITFFVNASSPNNLKLKRYLWDMGNGDLRETSGNNLSYKYNNTGNFNVKVTAIDESNFNASKSFAVIIGSPNQVANITLLKKIDILKNLKVKINEYNTFTQTKIDSKLNISDAEYELEKIKRSYASASYDDDYINIVEDLNDLDMPDTIYSSNGQAASVFITNSDKISVDAMGAIGEDKDEDIGESMYVDAINSWGYENVKMTMAYDKVAALYGDEEKEIVNVFDFKVDVNEDNEDEVYFVVKNMRELSFDTSYDPKIVDGYSYVKLNEKSQHVIFSTTEDVDVVDLPVFVSTLLGNLDIILPSKQICVENKICEKDKGETWKNCKDCQPFREYGLALLGLLVLYIILHIILQEWYKKHYENYLFKNKNFLFNIMNYIHQEKVKGKNDGEIEKNLKKSGWNSEQIRYAVRKFYGKRTGMWEIPMDWLFNNFRRNKMPKYNPKIMSQPQISIGRY